MSDFLWVEKYRPKKISDCILSEDLKNTFLKFLDSKELPNLLLSGTLDETGNNYLPEKNLFLNRKVSRLKVFHESLP